VVLGWERLEPGNKKHLRELENLHASSLSEECMFDRGLILTYLLTPWSRVLLEKLTSKLCS